MAVVYRELMKVLEYMHKLNTSRSVQVSMMIIVG